MVVPPTLTTWPSTRFACPFGGRTAPSVVPGVPAWRGGWAADGSGVREGFGTFCVANSICTASTVDVLPTRWRETWAFKERSADVAVTMRMTWEELVQPTFTLPVCVWICTVLALIPVTMPVTDTCRGCMLPVPLLCAPAVPVPTI